MKLFTKSLLFFILVVTVCSVAAKGEEPGLKFRVIVGEFEDKSQHSWYHGPPPGTGMADMLITALMKSGKFRVFERAALNELLDEKQLSMSDLANPGANAEQKLEIGDILVKATITEFGYKESKTGGALSGLAGRAGVGTYNGRVAVDMRLIDIGTSEVLWADQVAKEEKSRSLSVSTSEFSFGDQKRFDDHVVGKATRKVINEVVEKLREQVKNRPWQGLLITADDLLFIDGGTELGITPGMVFEIKRKTREVKHPKTGKVLKVLYDKVGVVKATEVEEGITTVEAVEGSGFKTGDRVSISK